MLSAIGFVIGGRWSVVGAHVAPFTHIDVTCMYALASNAYWSL